mmetsp:Transcript_5101/g.7104  ORF Transcript_5101/g.7104 Transcript_5101/m.7104 type:complete len:606 (+) Transcript_5101:108-1925(+)
MVVSAEKARQKAHARRQRILAKSAERLDVVSGLAPKGSDANDDDEDDEPATVNVNDVVEEVVVETVDSTGAAENDNIPSSGGGGGSKGARRMAAMRRRRYQIKKREDEASNDNNDVEGKEDDGAVVVEEMDATKEQDKESSEPTLVEDNICEPQVNEEGNDEEPPAAESTEEESPSSLSSEEPKKKKYMGVARMRRKIIKEQKAQRIAELEAASTDPIDAAATMATLGMTASMIREGSGSVVGEVDLSEVAIKALRGKKMWWKLIFPPMSLVPRLVTLVLLFMAGLDVGLEPHRMRNATDAGLNGVSGGGNLIYHVESSFTKPWEYGVGGKARHVMGMMDAAPPTSMPTSFSREGFCVNGGSGDDEECVTLSTSKEKERVVKKKLLSVNNDDEFAGSDEDASRPKGVSTSEFDDDEEATYSPPVIDPIFQVDLDALLQNSRLPAPINFAAKFAIGFHRMWVRYLWTVPTSVLKSILYSPKTLVTSWMANPPVFLFISLIIRVIGKLLVGKTPSFSEEEDENGPKGKKSDNFDILGKVKDTAMNYATSSFPKTILVLKTLKEIVSVDMYVILCGLLVGLVSPLVKQDLGFGELSIGGGKVLGEGEL